MIVKSTENKATRQEMDGENITTRRLDYILLVTSFVTLSKLIKPDI